MENLQILCFYVVMMPLLGAFIAGFFRESIGRIGAHTVTILGVLFSFVFSLILGKAFFLDHIQASSSVLYTWASGGVIFPYHFSIGFLLDPLSVLMMIIVTFVSLLVHIYSIGYMADDEGYQRFFSYISLFTFAMLLLVSANNFLQLFTGWEGVGLVSYLLIGFWFDRESANQGALKAFLVNRVGDFGFLLGIGLILAYTGSLDYQTVFSSALSLSKETITLIPGYSWSLMTVICFCLFVGAMGKSAQIPLHVWLPESMEGPTPISALIHAATMVTAGVFMVGRMSPLFEYSETALSFIMVIGGTGALLTGLIAIVMNDIKRVVAYSTLSQLGYMMVAMGASAYSAGIFHLATHACFKALLFLGAGSVIMGMHHEQDMRKMGGLWKYMPITYVCYLIGTLALCAFPPFSGFFSKDTIIEAVSLSHLAGASYAHFCVMIGAFVTALYSFRSFYMTFHGKERMDDETRAHLHESPAVVWLPLILLAVPSIILGWILCEPILFSPHTLLQTSFFVLPEHNVLRILSEEYQGPLHACLEAFVSPTFYLVVLGFLLSTYVYYLRPGVAEQIQKRFEWAYRILLNKYGFDAFNEKVFLRGSKAIGQFLFSVSDRRIIDGFFVNGSALSVQAFSLKARLMQTGYLYHYALAMVLGLLILLFWLMLG